MYHFLRAIYITVRKVFIGCKNLILLEYATYIFWAIVSIPLLLFNILVLCNLEGYMNILWIKVFIPVYCMYGLFILFPVFVMIAMCIGTATDDG